MSEVSTLEPTLRENVRAAVLAAAATPQTRAALVNAAKGTVTAKKDKEKRAAVEAILDEMLAAGELHKHGTAFGKDKPVDPNDPDKVRTAILDAAVTPQTKSKLVTAAMEVTKAGKKFIEGEVDKLVATQQLHPHGTSKSAPLGKDKPVDPNDPEKVKAALLEAAAKPQTKKDLVTAAVALTKAGKKFVEEEVDKLVATQQLHPHGTGKSAPLGRDNPNDPEKVRGSLLDAATTPQTLAQLVAAAVEATKADKKFVTDQANKLITEQQLHKHGAAKNAPLGREKPKPPHPLEIDPGKKAYMALVTAAKKVREVAPAVSLDELLKRLQAALSGDAATPQLVKPEAISPPVAPPVSPPIVAPKPEFPSRHLTPELIRKTLKAAYDELILFPEFESGQVEIRRLYHMAKRNLPELTVAQFHHELEALHREHVVELHALNEVQRAQERELAISRNDRLLYFVMWRKS